MLRSSIKNMCSENTRDESRTRGMPSVSAGTTVVARPRAFYSYAHLDWESSVRLVEELKLRGFHVFRDIERMREGLPLEGPDGRGRR